MTKRKSGTNSQPKKREPGKTNLSTTTILLLEVIKRWTQRFEELKEKKNIIARLEGLKLPQHEDHEDVEEPNENRAVVSLVTIFKAKSISSATKIHMKHYKTSGVICSTNGGIEEAGRE